MCFIDYSEMCLGEIKKEIFRVYYFRVTTYWERGVSEEIHKIELLALLVRGVCQEQYGTN